MERFISAVVYIPKESKPYVYHWILSKDLPIGKIMLQHANEYGIFFCTAASKTMYHAIVIHKKPNPITSSAINPLAAETLLADLAVSQVPRL